MKQYEIRADYDRDTIVVYQVYREEIGKPAVKNKKFLPIEKVYPVSDEIMKRLGMD
ncbi:DUF4291 family protein [Dysgonomonas sp.]